MISMLLLVTYRYRVLNNCTTARAEVLFSSYECMYLNEMLVTVLCRKCLS